MQAASGTFSPGYLLKFNVLEYFDWRAAIKILEKSNRPNLDQFCVQKQASQTKYVFEGCLKNQNCMQNCQNGEVALFN